MSGRPHPLTDLEKRLGYSFKHSELLSEALRHASVAKGRDNQRLEFLGDALLNFNVAFLIYRERPDWTEGAMSKLRNLLVCTEALAQWAMDLKLPLQTHVTPRGHIPLKEKPMADGMEALLAALYLDAESQGKRGNEIVLRLIEDRWMETILNADPSFWEMRDAKTTLQERTAALGLPPPQYLLLGQRGPGHEPVFSVAVQVGDIRKEASGSTRKKAETDAARLLLQALPPN